MQARANNDAVWNQLNHKVETRRIELNALISEANQKGINTDYASVSEQVISAFQMAAQHDRRNVERVRRIFQTFSYYNKTDPMAADQLAFNELKACLDVADHAAAELRRQLAREITLSAPPNFTKGKMELAAGYYRLDGRAVFPSSLIWMPKEEDFMQAFGRLGEGYYTLGGAKGRWNLGFACAETGRCIAGKPVPAQCCSARIFYGTCPGWLDEATASGNYGGGQTFYPIRYRQPFDSRLDQDALRWVASGHEPGRRQSAYGAPTGQ